MKPLINKLKYIVQLCMVAGILLTTQCKKDDPVEIPPRTTVTPPEESEPVNSDPTAPILSFPENNEELIALTPMFDWQESSDVDADAIAYNLYLGLEGQPLNEIGSNLTVTDFVLETALEKGKKYQWQVEAVDAKGASKPSEIFSFVTEFNNITKLTENADFSKRKNAAVVSFNGKIFLIGGENESGDPLAEVWSSEDGINWTMETENAAFGPRKSHAIIEFQNKLWMYNGHDNVLLNRDIWSSEDGITWVQEENDTVWNTLPFYGQASVSMFVYENKIWRFAAYHGATGDLTTERNIWSSSDGKNWTLETENHGFDRKYGMKVIPFQGQLIALEGYGFGASATSKIRRSSNVTDWEVITDNPPFTIGLYSDAIVHNERLYVTGGLGYNELWFTEDGNNWQKAVLQRDYPIKSGSTSIVFNNRIYIIGGNLNQVANDIWALD